MGNRCAKGGVEIGAFVTGGQLNEGAFVLVDNALHPPNVLVKFIRSVEIIVVINAGELKKERRGRAQFSQKPAPFTLQTGINRRQHPGVGFRFR